MVCNYPSTHSFSVSACPCRATGLSTSWTDCQANGLQLIQQSIYKLWTAATPHRCNQGMGCNELCLLKQTSNRIRVSNLGQGEKDLDCYTVIQTPIYR